MATQVQRRRGTTAEHASFTGAEGETTVDTTKDTVVVHDGATQGGFPLLREDMSNNQDPSVDTITLSKYAQFDTAYSATGNEAQGSLYWNVDERTLSLVSNGATIEMGQKLELEARNNTGSTIAKGVPVYASGTIGSSGRITVAPMIADGSIDAKYIVGVTDEQILNGEDGKVVKIGKIRKIDTSAYSEGDVLYVSDVAAGGWVNAKPTRPSQSLPIAFVVTSSAQVGEIYTRVEAIDENSIGLSNDTEITISAGTSLSGGGSFTLNQEVDETITLNHSPLFRSNSTNTGSLSFGGSFDAITGVTTDVSGHVSSTETTTFSVPEPNDGTLTVEGTSGLTGTGTFSADQGTNTTISLSHADTSSQGNVTGGGGSVINTLALDDYGHVTSINTTNLDNRFVNEDGDTMTGDLNFDGANVESDHYVADTTGWQISYAGNANFRSIRADELIVQAFIAEVAQALAGEDFLTKSVTLLEAPFTVPSGGLPSTTGIKVKPLQNIPSLNVFEVNDWLRFRHVQADEGLTVADVWAKVTAINTADADGAQNYTIQVDHIGALSGGEVIPKGALVLDYGQSGDYLIERSVTNRTGSSDYDKVPYDRIVQWTNTSGSGSPRTGDGATFTTISVVGNLGAYDASEAGNFGIYSSKALLTDSVLVGDLTKAGNYLEYDGTDLNVVADAFDLEAGNLHIDSSGTTYPAASSSAAVTTANVTDFDGAGNEWTANAVSINSKTTVKFYFDYDITVGGELEVLLEVSKDNGSTWDNYEDSATTAIINMKTEFCNGDADTGAGFQITSLATFKNSDYHVKFGDPLSNRGSRYGRVAVYVYVADVGDADQIRFKVGEINGSLAVCDATGIITQEFQPVTELNPSGVFTRLADAIILSNGDKYLDPSLIT